MKVKELALDGIVRQNPALKLVLGTCSILALSNEAINGLGMGAAVTFVLVCSNLVISILRNIIPDKVRIPAFILIIATFVTIVKMLLYYLGSKSAAIMGIYNAMGVFLPLIVVNCIILARAESFASHNTIGLSVMDGLFMGIGYTVALTLLGAVREILGNGSIFGVALWNFKIAFFTTPAGAFMTYGMFIALFTFVYDRIVRKQKLGGAKILKPKTTEV